MADKNSIKLLKKFVFDQEKNILVSGLTEKEAKGRLNKYGYNDMFNHSLKSKLSKVNLGLKNKFFILTILSMLSIYIMEKISMLFIMIIISCYLVYNLNKKKFFNSFESIESIDIKVIRDGILKKVPLRKLVVGDIVVLSTGDIVPADIKLIDAKGLEIDEELITGQILPVVKFIKDDIYKYDFKNPNLCFMGTRVKGGKGIGTIIATGRETYFSKLEEKTIRKYNFKIN